MSVPALVRAVLEDGELCRVAAATSQGPHVTPMVYATTGDRVWVTTSRSSVKARAWRADQRAAGLVRAGDRAVAFAGRVVTYDLLDAGTWGRSLLGAPYITVASARFTRRNARFFAGYAVDAHHVPLAWTPPGRVFAELRVERWVLFEGGQVRSASDGWGGPVEGATRFRAVRVGEPPLGRLPADVVERLGTAGEGALGLSTRSGPVVLPARWLQDGGAIYAVLPEEILELSGTEPDVPAALELDRPSWWRARAMVGAMVRGRAEVATVRSLSSGARSASALARRAGVDAPDAAVVRLRPERLVWWRGWSSGSVTLA